MRISRTQNRIRELMTIFVTQIKAATSQNDTYVNQLAENVLVPLFKKVYGWDNLYNINESHRRNFPAVDLVDDKARVAIQVTSTPDSSKIKNTLQTFINHELHKKYDRLIIYILTEKKQTYSGTGFDEILGERFTFNKDNDIWDFRDFLSKANSLDFESALYVEHLLEKHFGDENSVPVEYREPVQTEEVFLNLLQLTLPNELFLAQISVDREEVIKESKQWKIRLNHKSSTREMIRAALEQRNLRFGTDWICYEGKIITFHDLTDPDVPLNHVIDSGTVETFTPDSFYNIDSNYERVFKSLLWRTLQQSLFHLGIQWQNEENLFIFRGLGDDLSRRETWQGRNRGERMVYQRIMKDKKPDEALRHEHFGFRTHFKRFGDNWYLTVMPEWFASYDGYHRDRFGNFVEWKKRNENNQHVSSHARFIAYYLTTNLNTKPPGLFEDEKPPNTSFLRFGGFASFDNAPALNDNAYLPSKRTDSLEQEEEFEDSDQPLQMTFLKS